MDFIKEYIEGYKRRILKGAEKVIKKFKPKLAICYYNLPNDGNVDSDYKKFQSIVQINGK